MGITFRRELQLQVACSQLARRKGQTGTEGRQVVAAALLSMVINLKVMAFISVWYKLGVIEGSVRPKLVMFTRVSGSNGSSSFDFSEASGGSLGLSCPLPVKHLLLISTAHPILNDHPRD